MASCLRSSLYDFILGGSAVGGLGGGSGRLMARKALLALVAGEGWAKSWWRLRTLLTAEPAARVMSLNAGTFHLT